MDVVYRYTFASIFILTRWGIGRHTPHLVGITAPFPLLYGLHVIFVHSVLGKKERNDCKNLTTFIFYLLYSLTCVCFKFFFFYTAEEKHLVDIGALDTFFNIYNHIIDRFCYFIYLLPDIGF